MEGESRGGEGRGAEESKGGGQSRGEESRGGQKGARESEVSSDCVRTALLRVLFL